MQTDPAVSAHNLTFAYSPGRPVLDHLSFEVSAGESVGLVGPNGAGKTTLFLCLAGVLAMQPGQARVAGLDPGIPAERKKLPHHLGLVFQNSDDQLFCATVADDVGFGPLNLGLCVDEVRRRVDDALSQVGLAGFANRAPHHLAGGEKRRVALAGVLAMRPSILLLDEPSAFLDPRGRRELIHLLPRLPGTRIIASHDLDLILDTCQKVLLLDRGALVAQGQTAMVLENQNLLEPHGLEVPYRLRKYS